MSYRPELYFFHPDRVRAFAGWLADPKGDPKDLVARANPAEAALLRRALTSLHASWHDPSQADPLAADSLAEKLPVCLMHCLAAGYPTSDLERFLYGTLQDIEEIYPLIRDGVHAFEGSLGALIAQRPATFACFRDGAADMDPISGLIFPEQIAEAKRLWEDTLEGEPGPEETEGLEALAYAQEHGLGVFEAELQDLDDLEDLDDDSDERPGSPARIASERVRADESGFSWRGYLKAAIGACLFLFASGFAMWVQPTPKEGVALGCAVLGVVLPTLIMVAGVYDRREARRKHAENQLSEKLTRTFSWIEVHIFGPRSKHDEPWMPENVSMSIRETKVVPGTDFGSVRVEWTREGIRHHLAMRSGTIEQAEVCTSQAEVIDAIRQFVDGLGPSFLSGDGSS